MMERPPGRTRSCRAWCPPSGGMAWLACVIRTWLAAGAGSDVILGCGVLHPSDKESRAWLLSSVRVSLVFWPTSAPQAQTRALVGGLRRQRQSPGGLWSSELLGLGQAEGHGMGLVH